VARTTYGEPGPNSVETELGIVGTEIFPICGKVTSAVGSSFGLDSNAHALPSIRLCAAGMLLGFCMIALGMLLAGGPMRLGSLISRL
jgi:hypothetical protein